MESIPSNETLVLGLGKPSQLTLNLPSSLNPKFSCYDAMDTISIDFIQKDFGGVVLSYKDIVKNKKYFLTNHRKLHRSTIPVWDNTARRNNVGMIFEAQHQYYISNGF